MAPSHTHIWSVVLMMCLASVAVGGRMITQEGGSACKTLNVKRVTYRTPPLTSRPGQVNKKHYKAEFPKGHIGLKSVTAEFVYENGAPVPLFDVYLHHWTLDEYYFPKEQSERHLQHLVTDRSKHTASLEAPPVWPVYVVGQGGESRKTETRLPGPYVRESGKEKEGYETVWRLDVHGIDTRGAVNRMGCIECRCDLFNATTEQDGSPLPEGYLGGIHCCQDGDQCAVEEGFNGEEKTFRLQYSFEYIDWNECLIPVSEVQLDITNPDSLGENLNEFTVEGCGDADPNSEECIDTRVATLISPLGGDAVYTVSHLHATALNASLWGEDGRLICETTPIYGERHETGNEKGYVVGIKTCYGNPGAADAVKIKQGEKLKYMVQSTKVGGPHTGLEGMIGVVLVSDGVSAEY